MKTVGPFHIFVETVEKLPFKKINEFNTFIQQGCIKMTKSDNEDICYKIFIFQINAVVLHFLFIKESWGNIVYVYVNMCVSISLYLSLYLAIIINSLGFSNY